jgi:hypothetical protein
MKDLILSVYGNTIFEEMLIWTVILAVIISSFGSQIVNKIKRFNNHYHILGWNHLDDVDIYSFDDELNYL